jgi:hypothetical protein
MPLVCLQPQEERQLGMRVVRHPAAAAAAVAAAAAAAAAADRNNNSGVQEL